MFSGKFFLLLTKLFISLTLNRKYIYIFYLKQQFFVQTKKGKTISLAEKKRNEKQRDEKKHKITTTTQGKEK